MINGMAAALSGIHAGGKMLNEGAHNIANAQTEEFQGTRALPAESSTGGVSVTVEKDTRPGTYFFIQEDSTSLGEGSNVDLGEEMVGTLQAANLVRANISSFKIQNTVLGSLLDITE